MPRFALLQGLLFLAAIGCSSGGSRDDGGGMGGSAGSGSGGSGGAAGSGGGSGGALGGGGGSSGAAGAGGPCTTDSDCAFHADAGCCGVCLATSDPVPPQTACGANCGTPPSCLCLEGRCREGTLTSGSGCDLSRSECGRNLQCCRLCSPVGAGCDSPRCATPITIGGFPMCPQPS
jgi:hypothetical protein